MQVRSSLAKVAPFAREPDEAEAKRRCAAAWHDEGIVCLRPEWLGSWVNERVAVNLAEALYGKRKDKKG